MKNKLTIILLCILGAQIFFKYLWTKYYYSKLDNAKSSIQQNNKNIVSENEIENIKDVPIKYDKSIAIVPAINKKYKIAHNDKAEYSKIIKLFN